MSLLDYYVDAKYVQHVFYNYFIHCIGKLYTELKGEARHRFHQKKNYKFHQRCGG